MRCVAWGMLGVTEGRLRASEASCPQGLVNGLFEGICDTSRGSASRSCPLRVLSASLFIILYCPQSYLCGFSTLVCVRGKGASLVASCIAGEARCSLTCSFSLHHPSPPTVGGVAAERGSPGPSLCCLGKGLCR